MRRARALAQHMSQCVRFALVSARAVACMSSIFPIPVCVLEPKITVCTCLAIGIRVRRLSGKRLHTATPMSSMSGC